MLSLHLSWDNLFLLSSVILLFCLIKIRLLSHQFVIGFGVHNVVLIIINFLYNLQNIYNPYSVNICLALQCKSIESLTQTQYSKNYNNRKKA